MTQQHTDFTSVTEVSGYNVTQDQIDRALTRYSFARSMAEGKDVLEVACGSGQGLGLLAQVAKKVVGVDIDPALVKIAKNTYVGRNNIEIYLGNASRIPFEDKSFDLIILFEAIYYLPDVASFAQEAKRLLRPGGHLLICSANREWSEFNPSPFSQKYYSAQEYSSVFHDGFNNCKCYGSTPSKPSSTVGQLVGALKKMAVRMNLMPKTMKGKELFKRIFLGSLKPFPKELSNGDGNLYPLSPIPADRKCSTFKVVFFETQRVQNSQ